MAPVTRDESTTIVSGSAAFPRKLRFLHFVARHGGCVEVATGMRLL